ncbi:DUF4255 domain-containing protein [Nostoc parmelioides]|uniref:DUF4255 domain-containing protein n=1 Tax=Nostoc parmelioides FACHB-3921 TaxID=2692909 RepID=A0ABR8BDG0_9NOSO|nr:DUF4255 domain-containing protein [Nostoc parmelioides]MBD2251990.1 DUF4255 domain-containing protein [Nostoc parmelioides FACHB-3921]
MLDALDKSLENLLKKELEHFSLTGISSSSSNAPTSNTDGGQHLEISFEAPGSNNGQGSIGIHLFLYDIQENLELRSNNWSLQRSIPENGNPDNPVMAVRWRAPARVDCSYLITCWTTPSNAATEHKILGEVLKILLRYPRIPNEYLEGELVGLEPPIRAVAMRPSRLQSLGEFWQATGGKPKAAINYTVTIAVPTGQEEKIELVTQTETNFHLKRSDRG